MRWFFLSVIVLSCFASSGQRCGADEGFKELLKKDPALIDKLKNLGNLSGLNRPVGTNETFIIPVVFHVLYLDSSEVSEIDIRLCLKDLNDNFGKKNLHFNEIIPEFKGIADSAGIRFVLASKDPAGNCTSGINFYEDPAANWEELSPTNFSHTWNSRQYLNVYVPQSVKKADGSYIGGYAYLPGSLPPGDQRDAIVVSGNLLKNGENLFYGKETLTHELGHWFGLLHVFGYVNEAQIDCYGDDYVSDTPPTRGFYECPVSQKDYQFCQPGVSENFQNFMDYSYCRMMFTQGQTQRMRNVLTSTIRNNLWTSENLAFTGGAEPLRPCVTNINLNVFPNPSALKTNITFELPYAQTVVMNLMDLDGRIVFEDKIGATAGWNLYNLSLAEIPQGIYILRIKTSAGTSTMKLLVRRGFF
ncbi:MAG: zinc-dependent metalloprotease [Bacteroidia bacterium]|nr:zinc-dependent metalloprotease [Bacteroidia bacterium]